MSTYVENERKTDRKGAARTPATLLVSKLRRGLPRGERIKQAQAPKTDHAAILLAKDIIRGEKKLRLWTQYAVHSFGMYRGANEALKPRLDPDGDTSALIDWSRAEMAMMTILRVDALFDRKAEISFQTIYRALTTSGVREAMAAM